MGRTTSKDVEEEKRVSHKKIGWKGTTQQERKPEEKSGVENANKMGDTKPKKKGQQECRGGVGSKARVGKRPQRKKGEKSTKSTAGFER